MAWYGVPPNCSTAAGRWRERTARQTAHEGGGVGFGLVVRTGLGQRDATAAQIAPQHEGDERLCAYGNAKGALLGGIARVLGSEGGNGTGVQTLKRRPMMVILRFAYGGTSFGSSQGFGNVP